MGKYFAYARVSTPRQGERGVSLPERGEIEAEIRERQRDFTQRQDELLNDWKYH
jgi:hypothetical protein